MKDETFEVPTPNEKQASKFILDALNRRGNEADPNTDLGKMDEPDLIRHDVGPVAVGFSHTTVPDKKYFRIGEASEIIGVEPYVLRYWETEFKTIKPTKSGSGHRVYSRRDLESLMKIRHLLYIEKFSIKGAKKKLARRDPVEQVVDTITRKRHDESLKFMVSELKQLIQVAKGNPGSA